MAYPQSLKTFTFKENNKDKVVADDVNQVYTEVQAIEVQLGEGGVAYSDIWGATSTLDTTTRDWTSVGGLKGRLQNIENGLYAAYLQRISLTGGSTINAATGTVGLTIKPYADNGSDVLQIKNAAGNATVASITAAGTGKFTLIDGGTA